MEPLKKTESFEQLRALKNGYRIKVIETLHDSVEVDTPEELERVRGIIADNDPGYQKGNSL